MNYLINNYYEILILTKNHILVTFLSTIPAIFIGIFIGVLFSRKNFLKIGEIMLNVFGILQSIPSIAFIALIFTYTGIGLKTVVISLLLYSIVPITYNTISSIKIIPKEIIEAGKGMGLTNFQILRKIEVPLSFKGIISGIRTSFTINIATATVATVIGVDTLGKIILIGLRVRKLDMLWVGGVIIAILAIFFDLLFEYLENKFIKW
ncbi:MAG: ABC transporter permease [Caldisericia bacterium]|nr:ABC transporter permease [Caldisericia bacterium]